MVVVLAEMGGVMGFAARAHGPLVAFGMTLLICAAAGAGWSLAPAMTLAARALMLGVLMIFAGINQLGARRAPQSSVFGTLLALSRASAPPLAFGFAAWLGEPFTPVLGTIAAVVLTAGAAALDVAVPRWARRGAGAILLITGLAMALRALGDG